MLPLLLNGLAVATAMAITETTATARHLTGTLQLADLASAQSYLAACGGALSLGDSALLTGDLVATGAVAMAANAELIGGVDAVGAFSMGAGAKLTGVALTQAAFTIGAGGSLVGQVSAGAAATLGATATVTGNVFASGAVTLGAGATVTAITDSPVSVSSSNNVGVLDDVKSAYDAMWSLTGATDLNAAVSDDILLPGLYFHAAAWPLAAGRTITLTGNADDVWIIQINGAAAIGGDFELSGGASASNIQWIVSGAFSVGAGSSFYGTVLTPAAIAIAAGASFHGRMYSSVAACSIGASAVVSAPAAQAPPQGGLWPATPGACRWGPTGTWGAEGTTPETMVLTTAVSIAACQEKCSTDSTCLAYEYHTVLGGSRCELWRVSVTVKDVAGYECNSRPSSP